MSTLSRDMRTVRERAMALLDLIGHLLILAVYLVWRRLTK